jgi:hypothetical protein
VTPRPLAEGSGGACDEIFRLFWRFAKDWRPVFRLYFYVETTNPTLREILDIGLGEYLKTRTLPTFLHKAVRAMRRCRTAALGGHLGFCKNCNVKKAFYNSCGHRACPQCAFLKTAAWLEKKADQLLACDHFHVTFTIPQQLHRLWRYDYRTLTALGFQAVKETLFDLLDDPKYLGALPGLHLTFHSWNRAALFFPHFHGLVTGGGLGADGTWKKARRPNSLLPTEVMAIVFKAKFRDGFKTFQRRYKPSPSAQWSPPELVSSCLHRLSFLRATLSPLGRAGGGTIRGLGRLAA